MDLVIRTLGLNCTFWLIQSKNCTQTPFFVIVNFLNRKKFCQFHYCDYSSVRLVALLLQHEAAMTSFGGTMAHLTHFGLLHNGGKSSLKEHNNTYNPIWHGLWKKEKCSTLAPKKCCENAVEWKWKKLFKICVNPWFFYFFFLQVQRTFLELLHYYYNFLWREKTGRLLGSTPNKV